MLLWLINLGFAGSTVAAAVGGPYRVAVGEVLVTGRVAGEMRSTGVAKGEIGVTGAVVGEIDGRHV